MTTRPLFDADAATKLEAVYRTPDVVAQRHATLHRLALQPGERVLDVGAGPGFLVAEMAEYVGPDGHVTGLDIADSMVALAQRRCAQEPIASRTTIVKGDATALPFPDASFDVAVWNERFADPYLPRSLARRLRDAGFEVRSREVLVLFNPDYDPDTYSVTNGRIIADFIVGRQGITGDEVEGWTRDLEQLGREGDYFFSLNRYLYCAERRQP